MFPKGIPSQFSVVSTFNARGQRRRWSMLRAGSERGAVAVDLMPRARRLTVCAAGTRAVFFTEKVGFFDVYEIVKPCRENLHSEPYTEG